MDSLRPVILALLALGLCAAIVLAAGAQAQRKTVRPFLVYYGGAPTPGSTLQAQALARRMQGYPVVVLGFAAHAPSFAALMRRLLPTARIYGYADTGHVSFAHVAGRLALFRRLGFQGVLLDDIGTGLSSNRQNLRRILTLAYRAGLSVMLNAWDPSDALGLPLRPQHDGILCENWVHSEGAFRPQRPWAINATLRRLQAQGALVYMIATAKAAPSPAHLPGAGIAVTARYVFGDYLSLSDPLYSADSDTILPARSLWRNLRQLSF